LQFPQLIWFEIVIDHCVMVALGIRPEPESGA
jgi:hypothetical protein